MYFPSIIYIIYMYNVKQVKLFLSIHSSTLWGGLGGREGGREGGVGVQISRLPFVAFSVLALFSWLPPFHPFVKQCLVIGHFRVAPRQAKREAINMEMILFYSHACDFHDIKKGFAFVLKVRVFWTWKWPISPNFFRFPPFKNPPCPALCSLENGMK